MDEVLADLGQFSTRSGKIPQVSSTSTTGRRDRRSKALALSFTGAALILTALAIYWLFNTPSEQVFERIPVAVVDFTNETNQPELDGLSGMLITALEQSRRLSVLTRGRMFDILSQLQKEGIQRIDESLGKEICRQAGVNFMAIASIRKFGQNYSVDLKLLDHRKNEYLVTAKAQAQGQESIPGLIDKLAEETRKGLQEREDEIQATSRRTATVTTINLEAYQHFFKGEELLNKFREEEAQAAVAEFQKAVAIDSTFGLAYYRLGYSYHLLPGESDRARIALSAATALLDRMPEKEQYLARAYAAHLGHTPQELQAGLAILRDMEKLYPGDKEMIFFIGDWSYHNVQFETAREYLERVLSMDPDFRRGLTHLFMTYRDIGDYDGALFVAKQMHGLEGDADAYWMLGTAYGRLAMNDSSVVNLRRGLAISASLNLYRELAYVQSQRDSLQQAEAVLRAALAVFSEDIWLKYLLADVLVRQNRPNEALSFARRVAVESPLFHGDNLMAWVLTAGSIDHDEAIELAQMAMDSKPVRYPDRVRAMPYFVLPEHTLGLAYLEKRSYRDAVELLKNAEKQAPLRRTIRNDLQTAKERLRRLTTK
jgi:predicted Zn-dependent protease/TolB-like protein